MGMQKTQSQPKRDDQRSKESQPAQSRLPIAPAKVKIESGPAKPTDHHESVKRRVYKQQLPQPREPVRPQSFQPAQIHSEPKHQKNDRVAPVAELFRIGR